MDFYERGLYNHILASQDPATGGMIYYCPLKPGAFRTYSTPTDAFWCCVGTGMENHAKYPDTIYFQSDAALWVNLFVASTLTWRERGLTVKQETRFPDEDTTRLTFTAQQPTRLTLRLRYPSWALRRRVDQRSTVRLSRSTRRQGRTSKSRVSGALATS